jgi:hypothetical protein
MVVRHYAARADATKPKVANPERRLTRRALPASPSAGYRELRLDRIMKARLLACGAGVTDGMDWQASSGAAANLAMPTVAEPDVESGPEESPGDTAGDWLCAWCHHRVANEKDRFPYNGQDEFAFANPEGIRFAIITFARTLGCREVGKPTLENTWFAGYAWSFCQCGNCGHQLGWYYTGLHQFAGLIKDRIVRSLHVHN